jgi:small-conductance mechanosensitive channel
MGRGATTMPVKNQNGLATNSGIGAALMPNLEGGLDYSAYTPAQQRATNNGSLGALRTSRDSARQATKNIATTTGNSASLTPALDSTAQSEASALANQNAQNQEAFANDAQKQQQQAQQYLDELYGQNNGLFGSTTRTRRQLLNRSNSWFDTAIPASVGAALGAIE